MSRDFGLALTVLSLWFIASPVHANKVVTTGNATVTETVQIEAGVVYEQRFVVESDEIGLIDIFIDSLDADLCSEIRFAVGNQEEVLVDAVVDLSMAKVGDFFSVGFEPFGTTEGVEYWFGLMRGDDRSDQCLSLGLNTDMYPQGELVIDTEIQPSDDLTFRIAYDQPVGEYIRNDLANELGQKYQSQQGFVIFYGLLIGGMCGIVMHLWWKTDDEKNN